VSEATAEWFAKARPAGDVLAELLRSDAAYWLANRQQQRAARMAESTSGNSKRLIGRLAPTAESCYATKPVQRIKR
jgi:hypothetical protein